MERSVENEMALIKKWLAYLLNIPQTFIVSYEKDGNKYLRVVKVINRKPTELNFLVEHLLDSNLEVTEETLQKERRLFFKLPSSK